MRILEKEEESKVVSTLNDVFQQIVFIKKLYLATAEYFKAQGLPKLVKYFNSLADEKKCQCECLTDYYFEIDEKVPEPNVEIDSMEGDDRLKLFTVSLTEEQELTGMFNALANNANEEGDFLTFGLAVKWLLCQFKKEVGVKEILKISKEKDSSWLTKSSEILNVYTLRCKE